jgi:uncharacterized protein with GYD domain
VDTERYLLMVKNSATSAAAMLVAGENGAAAQTDRLASIGLEVAEQWVLLGDYDLAFVVQGSYHAVLAFVLAAESAGQQVSSHRVFPPAAASAAATLLDSHFADQHEQT